MGHALRRSSEEALYLTNTLPKSCMRRKLLQTLLDGSPRHIARVGGKEGLHFAGRSPCHGRAHDRLHLELGLAPHFEDCIPMAKQCLPSQALMVQVAIKPMKKSAPLLARHAAADSTRNPLFDSLSVAAPHQSHQQLVSLLCLLPPETARRASPTSEAHSRAQAAMPHR